MSQIDNEIFHKTPIDILQSTMPSPELLNMSDQRADLHSPRHRPFIPEHLLRLLQELYNRDAAAAIRSHKPMGGSLQIDDALRLDRLRERHRLRVALPISRIPLGNKV